MQTRTLTGIALLAIALMGHLPAYAQARPLPTQPRGAAPRLFDLRGRWSLDEGGGQFALDASLFGNHGTLGPTAGVDLEDPMRLAGVSPFGSDALRFDGIDDLVRIPRSPVLEPRRLSVELRARNVGTPGPFNYLVIKGARGCECGSYALYTGGNGGLAFYVCGASFVLSPDPGSSVWDGNWHHIVGTFDGLMVRLFVDGTEIGAGSPASLTIDYDLDHDNDLYIGESPVNACPGVDAAFSGDIDDVRIWSRALNPAEVEQRWLGFELL